jgi:hypothetical protein
VGRSRGCRAVLLTKEVCLVALWSSAVRKELHRELCMEASPARPRTSPTGELPVPGPRRHQRWGWGRQHPPTNGGTPPRPPPRRCCSPAARGRASVVAPRSWERASRRSSLRHHSLHCIPFNVAIVIYWCRNNILGMLQLVAFMLQSFFRSCCNCYEHVASTFLICCERFM